MPNLPKLTFSVLFPILGLLACDRPPAAVSFSVRDSAGVRIVENGGGGSAPLWEITTDPTLVIGQLDGTAEYLLDRVVAAYRLSDGGYVIPVPRPLGVVMPS